MFNSLKIAFSMYSKIPMPHTEWNNKNMKYAMCYFPLIGVVVGFLYYLWFILSLKFNFGNILRSAVFTVIPILVTGGIHVDGFIDTMDAINSYESRERKLEILKDPHIGAFALISTITYFVIYFGIASEINNLDSILIISAGFVLSRAFSSLGIVLFKSAKDSGLARTFKDGAHKNTVRKLMIIYIAVVSAFMIFVNYKLGLGAVLVSLFMFLYYKHMSYKKFGGITGDLAGFFLQMCELLIIAAVALLNSLI